MRTSFNDTAQRNRNDEGLMLRGCGTVSGVRFDSVDLALQVTFAVLDHINEGLHPWLPPPNSKWLWAFLEPTPTVASERMMASKYSTI